MNLLEQSLAAAATREENTNKEVVLLTQENCRVVTNNLGTIESLNKGHAQQIENVRNALLEAEHLDRRNQSEISFLRTEMERLQKTASEEQAKLQEFFNDDMGMSTVLQNQTQTLARVQELEDDQKRILMTLSKENISLADLRANLLQALKILERERYQDKNGVTELVPLLEQVRVPYLLKEGNN